ncbi:MAG: response regulator [Thermoleophilia bacterium]|nr:response regulator [Thermoleophilia bacterium]
MSSANQDRSQTKVLVADDETPIRLLVRVNLEAEGYTVVEASDGRQTLEVARAEHPDIILLDVMMPYKDGWEVAEELLKEDSTSAIPIIFLTARADLRDHERGLNTGALQYITKPFNPRTLAPSIDECLDASRSGDAQAVRAERLRIVRDLQVTPE